MSAVAWIILLIFLLSALGLLGWVVLGNSLVRVPSGSLGLLMAKGRATDQTLLPGPHFVFAFRRRMVEEYPSVEMAYRADGIGDPADGNTGGGSATLESPGPPLRVTLGDRTEATVAMTVRFQLVPERLREVHERFGPYGIFGVVRDQSARAIRATLSDTDFGIEQFFGADRTACEERLAEAVRKAVQPDGIKVTGFVLGAVELGKTGEVIQATVRARYELERERAEAETRSVRALNDANLEERLGAPSDAAWRYRETDLWRELVERTNALQVALRAGPGSAPPPGRAADDSANPAGARPDE
ncbi:SPFH domain-containing protein [Paractinoplanes globisporus]|uniref:SPFH domain-containing protein n=1 Tax=Paractinoplanes globisporus TaxID=113565 RepID=A0ABW6W9V2_9ACTN|nr:SPFH domain-containing protein [Actinoplanes globisporus]